MKKIITILLFIAFITQSNAKDLFDKLSKQTCKCLEKSKLENHEQAFKGCVEEVMLGNIEELKEYYHIQSISEFDSKDFATRLTMQLMKDCDIAYKYFVKDGSSQVEKPKEYVTDRTLTCDKLQNGKYYYLTQNQSNSFDTTHVIIEGDSYLEIIGTQKTYSKLSIKWISTCKFQLTFIESNDELKSAFSKQGEKYEYDIIQNYPDKIVVRGMFHEDEYFIEYFKE